MKTRKHNQDCKELQSMTGKGEGYTCICDTKPKKARGIPCSNMREFDAVMAGEPQPTANVPWISINIPVNVEQALRGHTFEEIVQAVNSHEELLKQLRYYHDLAWNVPDAKKHIFELCSACQTIAKAEGK